MDRDRGIRLQNCCSMKTGANLIGILYGLTAFYLLISSVEYTGVAFTLRSKEDATQFLNFLGLSSVAKYNVIGVKILKIITIIASVINGISYIVSAMLVIGVNNSDSRLLIPWILYFMLLLVIYIISMFLTTAGAIALYGTDGLALYISPPIVIFLAWCVFIVVVTRYYSELTELPDHQHIGRKNSEVVASTSSPQGTTTLHTLTPKIKPRAE